MPDTPESGPAATILAFDFGLRRIGVAVGQGVTGSAGPLATVANRDDGPDWKAIAGLIDEWRPSRLVVGMPLRADGSESAVGAAARGFMADLARFGLPVDSIDERGSSLEAQERLIGQRRRRLRGRLEREHVDAASAAVIAERWLSGRV